MTSMKFLHVIGTIMYVGCILSHIVISNTLTDDVQAVYNAYVYKELSAYILILPGIALKTVSGLVMYAKIKPRPLWLKIKLGLALFLGLNAFLILAPMMPEMRMLAEESLKLGALTAEFKAREQVELIAGVSNVIPLILAMVFGVFKPGFGKNKPAVTL
ncbi:MAG: DUF2269 family protein [Alphaproteobacteria bacterium]|nr:DUF2269 family protein [Alphaproteobacteria bacterium]